jgi:hypothetical protein
LRNVHINLDIDIDIDDAQANATSFLGPASSLTAYPNPFETHTMDYIIRLNKRG